MIALGATPRKSTAFPTIRFSARSIDRPEN
jgi:hypothetical protein